jgi:hypothetical protein
MEELLCGFLLGLLGSGFLIFTLETIHAAGRIYQLLFSGEEGMAARADFNSDIAFVSGPGFERVAARANHVHLIVGRVNSSFHDFTFSGNYIVARRRLISLAGGPENGKPPVRRSKRRAGGTVALTFTT